LSSSDDRDREIAIRQIRHSRDRSRVEDIVKAIDLETDDYLKLEMAETLLELGDKRGMPVIIDVMEHAQADAAREEARAAAKRHGSKP
jgi:HEAT repeat protein